VAAEYPECVLVRKPTMFEDCPSWRAYWKAGDCIGSPCDMC